MPTEVTSPHSADTTFNTLSIQSKVYFHIQHVFIVPSFKDISRRNLFCILQLKLFSRPGINTHFLFEEVLAVLERAQLDLLLLVLQLGVGQLEVGDEVIERLQHLLDGQRHQRAVLGAQTVQVSAW